MSWFPLTMICAFCIASADAAVKKYLPDYAAWDLLLVRFTVPAILLLPLAFLFPLPPVPPEFMWLMALLTLLEIGAMLLYVQAITSSPLHLTLPYLSFTPVFNIGTGYLFLGESVTWLGAGGVVLVFMGAYLLNLPTFSLRSQQLWAPVKAIWANHGSRLMLLAAAIYSLTSVLSKRAMIYADPVSFGPFYFVVIGIAVLIITSIIRPRSLSVLKKRPIPTMLVGTLMAIMVVTHFLAISMVEVAYMLSVKRSSLLFGIIYGALLFAEKNLQKNLLAGSIMLCGVVLLLFAR